MDKHPGTSHCKLESVLNLLTDSEHSVVDDTQLDSLFTLVKKIILQKFISNSRNDTLPVENENGCHLLYDYDIDHDVIGSVEHFVSTVYSSSNECHNYLPFALKLAGVSMRFQTCQNKHERIGHGDEGNTNNRVSPVFDVCHKPHLWEDASVRNAWLAGLNEYCQCKDTVMWLKSEGYLEVVHKCLQDSSIFVTSAAEKFLVKICLQLSQQCERDEKSRELLHQQLSLLVKNITSDNNKTDLQMLSLRVLDCLCIQSSTIALILLNSYEMESIATGFLQLENRKLSGCALNLYRSILPHSQSSCVLKLHDLVNKMFEDGKYTLAVKLITILLLNSPDEGSCDNLKMLLLSPLKCLVGFSKPVSMSASYWNDLCCYVKNERKTCALLSANLCSIQEVVSKGLKLSCLQTVSCLISHPVFTTCSTKVLQALLEALKNYSNTGHSDTLSTDKAGTVALQDVFNGLLGVLKDSSAEYLVISKAMECLVASIALLCKENCHRDIMVKLSEVLMQTSCDIRWEVRDTTVVTIGNICQLVLEFPQEVGAWFTDGKIFTIIWASMHDGESYVRASALQTLSHLIRSNKDWEQTIGESMSKETILDDVLSTIECDTEAFPRRAAVQLLIDWIQIDALHSRREQIYNTVKQGIKDFDWEVKMRVLCFWKHILESTLSNKQVSTGQLPSYASVLVNHSKGDSANTDLTHNNEVEAILNECLKLVKCGCFEVLFAAIEDYDQPVCAFACELLLKVKEFLHGTNATFEILKTNLLKKMEGVSGSQETQQPWPMLLDTLGTLESLELNIMLKQFSQTTDDYVRNPISLLDDILAAGTSHDEDVVVDCY